MAKVISLYFDALSADCICLSQTRTGAGQLIINGSTLDLETASYDPSTVKFNKFQRQVTVFSSGNLSGTNFIITGEDYNGTTISETIAGPNNATVTTTAYFTKVTDVSTSATIGTAATVGLATTGIAVVPMDYRNETIKYLLTFNVTGTISYTLQFTGDDIFSTPAASVFWWDSTDAAVVAATSDKTTTLVTPVTAFQVKINSSTAPAILDARIVESGISA